MTEQEVLKLIAQKTKEIQKLFDEAQKLADKHNVEFNFTLSAPMRWGNGEKHNILDGTYEPKTDDDGYGDPQEGRWCWDNSSLNC